MVNAMILTGALIQGLPSHNAVMDQQTIDDSALVETNLTETQKIETAPSSVMLDIEASVDQQLNSLVDNLYPLPTKEAAEVLVIMD
ncbi:MULTISPECIES: hypothetical protein [Shewanella]|uniref:hypothetical protein n=1 Tax=Shewanella TaxID=22 RepID=UPI00048E60ED|nr:MULTISPECIES: hypothetical protein [Shewanella]QLE85636.1 hypothetical protein FLM48_11440 [Shewanella sp. Scap07]